ncbi:MAG: tetratricopeptide repeat protein [Saprospiraceae bacterium]
MLRVGHVIIIWLLSIVLLVAQDIDHRFSESKFKVQDRFVKAKLLVVAGKKDDAIKLLDSIRREDSNQSAVYFEIAKLYFDKKDYNQAENNINSAIKLDPNNIWYKYFAAEYYQAMGRNDDAIQTFQAMILLDPKNSDLYNKLMGVQISKEDFSSALNTLDAKEKNIGWSVNTTLKKAEILESAGKLNDAVAVLNTLNLRFPKEVKYLKLIASILHSNGKVAETEPYMKRILAIDPNDHDAKLALILLEDKKGSKDDFLVTLHPLISNPDAPIDMKIKELLPFVQQHAANGDTILGKKLIEICDKLVIAHPNDAKAHAIYGDLLKNNGNTLAAIRQYEKCLTLNKSNFAVWEQLMYCLDDVDNFTQLGKTATDAMDFFPNQAISYYFKGKSLIAQGDTKKATSYLDEASMISAGNPNVESRVLTSKAVIAINQKDEVKANDYLNEALRVSQDKNADAYELKGDLAFSKKDVKSADKFWKNALMLGGKASRINLKLANLNGN